VEASAIGNDVALVSMTRPSDFMSSLSFSLSSLAQCPARVYSFVSLTLCDFLSSQYLS
jgi:hypothetical protein